MLLFYLQMRGLAKEYLADIVAKFEPCPLNLQRMVLGIDGMENVFNSATVTSHLVYQHPNNTPGLTPFSLQVSPTSWGVPQVISSTPSTTRWTRTWHCLWIITSSPRHTTPTWQETSCSLSLEWKCTPTFCRQAVAVWRVRACATRTSARLIVIVWD